MSRTIFVALALSVSIGATANAASYSIQEYKIYRQSSVWVSAVNDNGVAVGQYNTNNTSSVAGFMGRLGQAVTLPFLFNQSADRPYYVPAPTSINNRGTVVGTFNAGDVVGFALQSGKYTTLQATMVAYQPFFAPYAGTGDNISANGYTGHGDIIPFTGTVSAQHQISNNSVTSVASINVHAEASGQSSFLINKIFYPAVFVADTLQSSPVLYPVLPPHAQASYGGWINDQGQVAGSYVDATGGLHGFIQTRGSFTYFDMLSRPKALTVQGIDNTGRVVGTYSDGAAEHGFVYSHGAVMNLGVFPLTDSVHVNISPAGRYIALADSGANGARSWLVTCKIGASC